MSALPETAASVRTRVVSWNDAAEMNERVCSDALVIPSSTGLAVAGFLPSAIKLVVEFVKVQLVKLLVLEQAGITRIDDFDLLQHLAHDHFDVLVVDQHALQTIDFLDFIDEVTSKLFHALDGQNVVRRRVAVEDVFTLLDGIAFLEMEWLALRDQVLDRLFTVRPAA